MLYFQAGSRHTRIFSDKHYRHEAIEMLEKFRASVYCRTLRYPFSMYYDDPDSPPFLFLDKDQRDEEIKTTIFELGVKEDAENKYWLAAKAEQCVQDAQNEQQMNIEGVTGADLFPNNNNKNRIEEIVESRVVYGENSYLQQYVIDACRTECGYDDSAERISNKMDLLHAAMGICTEAGELQDQLKRYIFYGKQLDVVNLEEELGDICWYVAILCKALGVDWENALKKNIAKLKARYPDKFTEHHAVNRDLEAERSVLEENLEGNGG